MGGVNFEVIVLGLEGLGVLAMIVGFAIAVYFSARALFQRQGGKKAFHLLRMMIGSAILLGLEILVAADLIRTVMEPSLEEASTTPCATDRRPVPSGL